ncbi:MAG: hypothetical protein DSM106950_25820 [Stigonema ocellatum SAG 48.90 = DSM 106950]|nr:hypothetical protein [Stigonema ocellatum SAG 48.90 = DSM 106950]
MGTQLFILSKQVQRIFVQYLDKIPKIGKIIENNNFTKKCFYASGRMHQVVRLDVHLRCGIFLHKNKKVQKMCQYIFVDISIIF